MTRFLLPLVIFLVLVGFLAVGLNRDPREVPSPLVGKAAPAFQLPQLAEPAKTFAPGDMKGRVWLLNVWASWCSSCRDEHPLLVELARAKTVPLVGMDYKDQRADAMKVLTRAGDPYDVVAFDESGRIGIDYGVYGVPETYVIDKDGVIRYKQIGALTREALDKKILPLVAELSK